MNDRTRWDDPRRARGDDDNRQDSYGRQGSDHSWQQHQQDRGSGQGRQQGAWHEEGYEDSRRAGSYHGNEWRGERDWGSPSYGERSTSSGPMHRDEMGEATRLRQDRAMREHDLTARDVGARLGQDWYARDTGQAGSQSFAAGYGMSSGPNYDQWGAPERRAFGHSGGSDPTFGRGYGPDYGRNESRGFLERAGDEIASWFGNGEAARRREEDYRGHGPSDYTRSDERIREDVNDRLTDDPRLDARHVSVAVQDGEVTLSGTVGSRDAKRRAEDCIDRISGVKHVQNNLRVEERSRSTAMTSWSAQDAASHAGKSNLGGATTGTGSASTMGSGSTAATGTGTTMPATSSSPTMTGSSARKST